ncbi:retinal-specific ATP-binding cassette transporter-like isoform X3 [Varroa jacobsoni]|uniref:retinal-specific ATP-binding cassette transporter-like isoform X3 n=1 Tax=Varroa jacobsoni TaxID=62625 RepID=UPI000BF33FE1|nr:retinal-specific ATP-binding cassette transporter-like isoform X3 [Varroa jacobsoni]
MIYLPYIIHSPLIEDHFVRKPVYWKLFRPGELPRPESDDMSGHILWTAAIYCKPQINYFYFLYPIYYLILDVGVQWTNIAKLASPGDSVSLLAMLIAIVLSCVLYMFLIFYLDAVNPWQPGIPKPLFFLCQSGPCYTLANEESSSSQRFITKYSDVPSYLIEKPPAGTKNPAIEICDVTYRCDNKKVLSNLSLEFYQKEISVLLGHNGAGKTTAMSILAGLLPPTSGKVYINGLNVQKNTTAARRDIGLCPQHNALFDDLTVREHLVFFARIRGANSQNAEKEANESIMQFEFFPQEGVLARNLSAGIKRRLCMANAMIGGSSIVILDEPTTGMDPEVRRRVWTILQEARQDRTILMTTHDMNEADFLGDRIAILANGKLKCTGSPIFLKKAFETGYNLRCMKSGPNTSVKSIVERLQICLDDDQVRLVSEVGLEFTINLGFPNAAEFIKLFRDLETNKDKLGIASWGVSVTTIEDVFLKVDQLGDDLQSFPRKSQEQYSQLFPRFTRITGSLLRRRQFYAILLKRSRVIRRQWFMLLVLIVIPGILVIYFARWAQSALDTEDRTEPGLHYSFRSFSQGKRSQGFIQRRQQNFDSNILELKLAMEEDGLKVHELDHDTNVDEFLLDQAISNPLIYKTLWKMGGVSNRVKPMEIALWFNAEPYHVPAIALVRWQTALLRQLMLDFNNPNGQDEVTVDVTNHPFTSEDLKLGNAYFQIYLFFNVFILIQLAVSFMACAMIYIPIEERASKAELLQMMTGVSRSVYFGAVFTFDFLTILLCSGIIATLIALCNPTESIATEVEIGGATCILLCSYGAMMILVSYVCSYMLSTPGTDFAVFLAATVLGGGVIAPILIFAWGVCTSPGSMRKYCYKRESLFVMNATSGVGFQVVALLTEGALVLLVLIAIETGLIRCCLRPFLQFKAFIYRRFFWIPTVPLSEDSDVKAEKHKVLKIITKDNQSHYALVADNLTKTYDGFVAVNHISFAVDHGECFGLLGSNGAGKSTTFRMLTGDLDMSEGNAYICGANLRTSPREYQTNVGFCPQTDALIDKLSGKEMLELFCALRGVPSDQQASIVTQMVSLIDLEAQADNLTQTYSGGMKRRLSLGLAVIGNLSVVLLDEPTAGIDPSTRRKIWTTLAIAQEEGTTIILTSHSINECEALCDRMAIMVNGMFQCLGSSQYLKSKFSQGFTFIVKLRPTDIPSYVIPKVLTSMKLYFPNAHTLKDTHQFVLHFHITDAKLRWSELFQRVQELKEEFNFEDIFVSDSSLEQVFLSFAKARKPV